MIGKNVKSKKPVCLADAECVLAERKKGGELGFEQKSSLTYCEKFAKVDAEDASGLFEDLAKFEKLDEEARVKIADILPAYASQVRIIAQKGRIELSSEDVEGILKAVRKYLEASKKFQEAKEEKRKERKAKEDEEKELAEEKKEAEEAKEEAAEEKKKGEAEEKAGKKGKKKAGKAKKEE